MIFEFKSIVQAIKKAYHNEVSQISAWNFFICAKSALKIWKLRKP